MHSLVRLHHLALALLFITVAASYAPPAFAQGTVLISEFRYRGPNGPADEFVEIYNNTDSAVTVSAGGWALVTGDSPTVAKFVIPGGTVIPARGRFLITNAVGYSLFAYPAGNGTTATGDGTYLTDIPDNVGLALFNTSNPLGFTLANRLDAVGTSAEANTLFREGAGLPPVFESDIEYTFARHVPTPCPQTPNNCGATGGRGAPGPHPQDTNDNVVDFFFMDTLASDIGAGQRLGAPSPQNLSSPRFRNLPAALVDGTAGAANPPNRVRDFTSDPGNNSTFGTLTIRRRITNNTGAPITRLRFFVTDITTFPTDVTNTADLRVRTSLGSAFTSNDGGVCAPAPAPCTVLAQGTTLEEPPFQPAGGGWHSTLSANNITLAQPLAPGASINIEFLLGLEATGYFRFWVDIETLP